MDYIWYLLVGVGAGFLGALFGIGGGIILIPSLTLFLQVPIKQAIGASLLSFMASSCAVVAKKIENNLIHIPVATCIESITLLFGMLGASLALYIAPDALMKIFSIMAIAVAIVMFRFSFTQHLPSQAENISSIPKLALWHGAYFQEESKTYILYEVKRKKMLFAISSLVGTASGLLGIGGGMILVPTLTLLAKVPIKVATATSSYTLGLTAWGSSLIFLLNGELVFPLSVLIILGVFLGNYLSIKYFSKITSKTLILLFCFLLIVSAIKMW